MKISGKTKQEVRAKLQALHEERNAGVKSLSTYTLREAVDDWLREGLDGTSERTRTLYEFSFLLSGLVRLTWAFVLVLIDLSGGLFPVICPFLRTGWPAP